MKNIIISSFIGAAALVTMVYCSAGLVWLICNPV